MMGTDLATVKAEAAITKYEKYLKNTNDVLVAIKDTDTIKETALESTRDIIIEVIADLRRVDHVTTFTEKYFNIIESLTQMSDRYEVIDGQYVIPKSRLDNYIIELINAKQ